jgi:FtsZ-binding cell division protein ZapB
MDQSQGERLTVIGRTCRWTSLALLIFASLAGAVESDRIDNIRALTERWVETRRVISKERQDWTLGREMLEERIKLVEREIASLREKIDEAQKSIGEADARRAELVDENETLRASAAGLTQTMAALEARTMVLDRRLPDPVRERMKPLSQRIPADPNDTKLSLAQRFQNVIGLLNEVNKFNRAIEVTSEIRAMPDGSAVEVAALYVGLGQAYYSGANGTAAGVGRPAADGWHWEPAAGAAEQVADVLAILKNEKVAGFVPLPATIDQGTANVHR